ncbi:hypothetical protein M9H77_06773 [Catharanthus roseus]|uniref:Uncharacterized protein n=1 Tax=Catharanthus roseus TaxID=4058 RepID=A0ACC0BTF4_CATRO|nr:hypothetical protein M9H77_06773 [Catharanthus roseus]
MAMSTGCSQSSSSSTTNPPFECGIPTPVLTSNTSKSKGRKFFGCGHFKLDDACIIEDTASNKVDNLLVLLQMEEDIANLKVDSGKLKNDIEDIKKMMDFHLENSGHKKTYGPKFKSTAASGTS